MKRILTLLIATVFAVIVQGLSFTTAVINAYSSSDEWLIYWYLCGSDLESDEGAATED